MAELTFAKTYYTQFEDWEMKEEQRLIIKTPEQVLNLQESCGVKTYYTQFGGCDSEQRRLINVTDTGIYNLQEACERFFANTGVQPSDLERRRRRPG